MAEQNKVAQPTTAQQPARRIAAPAFRIRTAKPKVRYSNTLIYGEYGSGKTTLAASADDVPDMRDVLFISVEAGDKSIENRPNIDVVDIHTYAQFARVFEFLVKHCEARDSNNIDVLRKLEQQFKAYQDENGVWQLPEIEKPKQYKTVIIDTLTEVQKYCMYQLLGINVGTFALDMEPDNPQFAEWGRSAEMIRLLIRSFRDLPMHTIMVAARLEEQDERKRFHYKPALPGKLANEVQGFFDTVGLLVSAPAAEGGKTMRRLYLEPGQTFQAKNRFVNFSGQYIDNPTMAQLYALEYK